MIKPYYCQMYYRWHINDIIIHKVIYIYMQNVCTQKFFVVNIKQNIKRYYTHCTYYYLSKGILYCELCISWNNTELLILIVLFCYMLCCCIWWLQDNFKTGNVIQLVSQSSGHSLQVVVGPAGQLVVDGMGPEGPTVYHGEGQLQWNL